MLKHMRCQPETSSKMAVASHAAGKSILHVLSRDKLQLVLLLQSKIWFLHHLSVNWRQEGLLRLLLY